MKHTTSRLIPFMVMLLLIGMYSPAYTQQQDTGVSNQPDSTQLSPTTGKPMTAEEQKELNKKKLRLLMFIIVITFTLLILMIVVITSMRTTRRKLKKLGIGQKHTPTEYVDAWSQHKLKDEDLIDPEQPTNDK